MPSIKWNDAPDQSYNTASLLQRADDQSKEDRALGYRAEKKLFHQYKGFVAHKHGEYENLWGPVIDANGNTVDELAGVFNNTGTLQKEIDQYLEQKKIQDKRKEDNIARNRPTPVEEPTPIAEVEDNTPPPPSAVYIQNPKQELLEKINE